MRFQNSSVDRVTPAVKASFPKLTMSGTIEMPSEAALAGSMSDAESVTIATRPTGGPPSFGAGVFRG